MTNEHRWGQGPLRDLKFGQNLDFLKLGQRRLGTSGVVRVDIKVVPIDVWKCLELFVVVYCWSGTRLQNAHLPPTLNALLV